MEPDVRGFVGLKSVEKGATVKSRYTVFNILLILDTGW
jgi:hypothetical protein